MSGCVKGKVVTVRGEVAPEALGGVLMHEHLYASCRDWDEGPTPPPREQLLMEYAVPNLKRLHEHGCHAMVDATPMAWRAWPDTYLRIARAADLHVVLSTGFYREMEVGTYWVQNESQAIWPAVREKSVQELTEMCVREITEGIHGSAVRAGVIKLGSSGKDLTPAEAKAFRAGAAAQQATGVSVTTHCTAAGAHVTQLTALAEAGVDPGRVVIGHTARHLVDEAGTGWTGPSTPSRGRSCLAASCRPRRSGTCSPTPCRDSANWGLKNPRSSR